MAYIGKAKIGSTTYNIGSTLYFTCSTAEGTAAKATTDTSSFTLETGVEVRVKFTNTNTASNPTLKVGNSTAKAIYKYDGTPVGPSEMESWAAGSVVGLTYDGTNWILSGGAGGGGSKINSRTSAGILPMGMGSENRVWETNDNGDPAWRDPNLLYFDVEIDYQTGRATGGPDKDLYNLLIDLGWDSDTIIDSSVRVFFKKDTSGSSVVWRSIVQLEEDPADETVDGKWTITPVGTYDEAVTGLTITQGTESTAVFSNTVGVSLLAYTDQQVELAMNSDDFTISTSGTSRVVTFSSAITFTFVDDDYIMVQYQ